jgi:carbon-monoxide dehydrogenase medium subunit
MSAAPSVLTPTTVEEAVSLLAREGENARPLSGGATLVAMMNAKLAEPSCLVSLSRIPALREFKRLGDGTTRIGAMRRHRETAFESDLRDGQCVVSMAASKIANPPVRNMGTMGGSISFADPAADYPPALVAADATVEIAGPDGIRAVPAEDFFLGWYETALEPGEIVTAVLLPPGPPGAVGHYEKLCRVAGDFALVSVAVRLAMGGDDTVSNLRIAIGGCGGGPIRLPEVEDAVARGGLEALRGMSNAISEALDPIDDVRGSADYRRAVAPRLLSKALRDALEQGKVAA